jgi:hypothetical protein
LDGGLIMSRDGRIELTFAGDLRIFRLKNENLFALEDICDCPCEEILNRLSSAGFSRVRDIRETIRLGLIGAGCDGKIAARMVDEHVSDGALAEHKLVAFCILAAAWSGDPREQVGKEGAATDTSEADAFPPPRSTATAP